MKEKATIFDYARVCKNQKSCKDCPISITVDGMYVSCLELVRKYPYRANEIMLKWCKEHPIKTRQSEFLKMFPNAQKLDTGILSICPNIVDTTFNKSHCDCSCLECYKNYWLAEIDE